MGTVIGFEFEGGAVIAGDRLVVEGNTVRSRNARKVFDYDRVGAGAVGSQGDVKEFSNSLESEIRKYGIEHGNTMRIERAASVASSIAKETNINAIVSAHDADEIAEIRQIDSEGGVLEDDVTAVGSGSGVALGFLEGCDTRVSLDEAKSIVQECFETVAERDPRTGDEFDIWSLENR
ncbi:MAG: 20S proteasome subunit A/B [Halobacteria archaeon]|nr:20S proteasome subunit A/B [Halobacteria archaeon]